jgi:ABC-type transport system involved in multi-copper enzyme maturation permease subunit/regulation of enolase protein 1 (concanavalin A-like superfamily)
MRAAPIAPRLPAEQPGKDGFAQVLSAEWTKFATVRGWVITAIAVAAVVAVAVFGIASISQNNNHPPVLATVPGGESVTDAFYFVHQPVSGDGSITVRVTALVNVARPAPGSHGAIAAADASIQPWAKAGIMVKDSTTPGSRYASVVATASHGVQMQDNFTRSVAGSPGAVSAASPQWLRLSRSGDTLTGYESADGSQWTEIGAVSLPGLPSTVQAGLLVASPMAQEVLGTDNVRFIPTQAAAEFDNLGLQGQWSGSAWTGTDIGQAEQLELDGGSPAVPRDGYTRSGGTFTVAGSGDMAPFVPAVDPMQVSFYGSLFGLLMVIALGALFITVEYRRGMIRWTLTASPRRGRVLAAKAIVVGGVAFVVGLIGTAITFPIAAQRLQSEGWTAPYYQPLSLASSVGVQVVVGTAALLAVVAVLAVAIGTLLRRSAGTITTVLGLVVFPLVLSLILPSGPASWLLKVTPAAAFGVQQTLPRYSQAPTACLPYQGCYPLSPWAGFLVLCAWTAVALGLALLVLRTRDA